MKVNKNIKPIVVTLIAIGFFVAIKWQFPIYKIQVATMFNQYEQNNYILVSKLHAINTGDVVVFEHEGVVSLSRVVGVSGDKIQCVDTRLQRNGEAIAYKTERFDYAIYCDSTIAIDVKIAKGGADYFIAKGVSIPPNSAIELIQGGAKIVLQSGDTLEAVSDTASSLDVTLSYIDTISS